MNLNKILKTTGIIFFFLAVAFSYNSSVLKGKRLNQSDQIQGTGAAQEILQRAKATGEWSWWTNSMFSGMPSYLVQSRHDQSIVSSIASIVNNALPVPVNFYFIMMIGMFLLLRLLKIKELLAVAGSIAFAFGSFNAIYLEAGHNAKLIALSFVPYLIYGVLLCYQRKYILGAAITALAMGFELYANHFQITYYSFFLLAAIFLFYFIESIRTGWYKNLLFASLAAGIGILVGVGSNLSKVWSTYEYSKETIRSKSELTPEDATKQVSDGLNKDYAFNWSQGINETMTFFIPNFMGGSSQGRLNEKSASYKTLTGLGVDAQNASLFTQNVPMYIGDQPGTAPEYMGAIVIFLSLLALFISKNNIKWVFFGVAILFTVFSWGKNFPIFNFFIFDNFPFFNKFRDVKQILIVAQICFAALAVLAVNDFVEQKYSFKDLAKPIIFSLGILVVLFISGYITLNFSPKSDENMLAIFTQQFGNNKDAAQQLINAIVEDRQSAFWGDTFRSFAFVIATIILLYLASKSIIKETVFSIVFILLILIDMLPVSNRFLDSSDFKPKVYTPGGIEAANFDNQILQDKSPSYRVYNITGDPFQSARDSYFHKSLGGYHAAKMRRYNELIERQISKGNMGVLNMLNTKYFIVNGEGGAPTVQANVGALGNAWFVNEISPVKNADEEMKSLTNFDPKKIAYVDVKFADAVKMGKQTTDSTSKISLTTYSPDKMEYNYSTKTEGVAIFSEIFYRGNEDWKAYINGVEAKHFRANYVLRGLGIPAGNGKIVFEFKPKSIYTGGKIDLISSILVLLALAGALFFEFRKLPKVA